MSFIHAKLLIPLIAFCLIFSFFSYRKQRGLKLIIEKYWSYRLRSKEGVSFILNLIGFSLLAFSVLDLRGPEELIETGIPDQKTIILIDASASMLTQDVRPDRFSKAILLARHFVKKAVGHQIAVVLFSDITKKIMPFTDDIDLLDSVLSGLEKSKIPKGSSNIETALKESIAYFEDFGKKQGGNIFLITDGEENGGPLRTEMSGLYNIAVAGVGTLKGGKIPLKTSSGQFLGIKKYQGEEVVSKLDEKYLKVLGKRIKNYKYWTVRSFGLPTDQIVDYFRNFLKKKLSKGQARVREVYSHYLAIVGILIFCLSVALSRGKRFSPLYFLVFGVLLTQVRTSIASDARENNELPKKIIELRAKIKSGNMSADDRLRLGDEYLKLKKFDKARNLYEEGRKSKLFSSDEIQFNYATSQIGAGDIKKGINTFSRLLRKSSNSKLKRKIEDNLGALFKYEEEQKKKKENNKDKKKDKDNDKNDQNKENKNKKDQKDSEKKNDKKDQKDSGKKNDKKDQKDNKENESDKSEKEDQGKKDKGDDQKEEKNSKGQKENKKNEMKNKKDKLEESKKDKSKEEKEESKKRKRPKNRAESIEEMERKIRQARKKQKVPGPLNQMLDIDRKLHQDFLDTSTEDRDKNSKKDW